MQKDLNYRKKKAKAAVRKAMCKPLEEGIDIKESGKVMVYSMGIGEV